MSVRSRFLESRDPISKLKQRFEAWLTDMNYDGCTELYPAAVLASALVDEYLQEYPEHGKHKEAIEQHAEEIGWVSDYGAEEDDEIDPDG
jgi:hypothetical protein